MEKKDGEIQVFELTMDNPEDQDALNRQLRKLVAPLSCTAPNLEGEGQGESATESPNNRPGYD